MIDFGMAAKVRPALLLTGEPAADELDLGSSGGGSQGEGGFLIQ